MGTRDIVRELNGALDPTLVATLAGSRDRQLPAQWARDDGPEPPSEASRRLVFAHEQWALLAAAAGAQIARQWFIGGNPHLGEDTPITAIREDRYAAVAGAVQAFIELVSAVAPADRLREYLSSTISPRVSLLVEAGRTIGLMENRSFVSEGADVEGALEDLVLSLREYAEDWEDHLQQAPNHSENWALVQLVKLSTDEQLIDWFKTGGE